MTSEEHKTPANYHDQLLLNRAIVREQLAIKNPGSKDYSRYNKLVGKSAHEVQDALLAMKKEKPRRHAATNLVYAYHDNLRDDQNCFNAITESLIKQAVVEARDLDDAVKADVEHAKQNYPLYGFVLGLKESFKKKGTRSTAGMFKGPFDCTVSVPFIEYLERKGAVFLAKTNVPQMLFAMESNNNIYGNGINPIHKDQLRMTETEEASGKDKVRADFNLGYIQGDNETLGGIGGSEQQTLSEQKESKKSEPGAKGYQKRKYFDPIKGETLSKTTTLRTCGGSSGGDGILVGLNQVPAALGSDIAGSARIPAAFCGVHSMMFSPSRIDRAAHVMVFEGHPDFAKLSDPQFGVRPTFGVTCRDIDDLEILAKVVIEYYQEMPRIAPVPWRTPDIKAGDNVGVILEFDNLMELTPANRRAMDMAKDTLKKQGYNLIDIDMRESAVELMEWIPTIFGKNRGLMDLLNGKIKIEEPLIKAFDGIKKIRQIPHAIIRMMANLYPDKKSRCFLKAACNEKIYNTEYIMGKIWAHRTLLLEKMKENNIKVLLCPSMMPAPFMDQSGDLFPWVLYMNMWNAFGWTAGHFTLTKVRENEQEYTSKFNGAMENAMKILMKNSAGLPVGVQVVAPEWHDEYVVHMLKELQKGHKLD